MIRLKTGKLYRAIILMRGCAPARQSRRNPSVKSYAAMVLAAGRVIMALGDNQVLTHKGIMFLRRTEIETLELVENTK